MLEAIAIVLAAVIGATLSRPATATTPDVHVTVVQPTPVPAPTPHVLTDADLVESEKYFTLKPQEPK